uniref:Sodium/hydrogen exchanger 9B1 n=1 Tax=Cacopsylla melanoneura TaxID=428564 RepID=A0A8D8SMU6_9HEMI
MSTSGVRKIVQKYVNGYDEIYGDNNPGNDSNNQEKMTESALQLESTRDSVHPNGHPTLAAQHVSDNFLKRFLQCPLNCCSPTLISYISWVLTILLFWGLLYCLLQKDAIPGGPAFNICLLILVAQIFGKAIEYLNLPSLLGMLIAGIFMKNVGLFSVDGAYEDIVIHLREIALSCILIKAGLGLDAAALLKLSFVVLRLALLPCLAESTGAAIASHFILGFPWLWGLLLGFILSAVSPAVVVPTLLELKENGYGNDKSISTLVIAASSVDDIAAISMFGVLLGCLFSEGDLTSKIVQGPLELLIGVVWGLVMGLALACFPHREDKYVVSKRSILLGGVCTLAVLGSQVIDKAGAGPLGCVITAFMAGVCWKMQGWSNDYNPVADVFAFTWKMLEITLFGLIGTEIDLWVMDIKIIFAGVIVLLVGLSFRIVACCIALIGANLTLKEVLFVNLAWLPKATVQAALAPVALNLVKNSNMEGTPDYSYASSILTIAVLSILITAPLGAIGITYGGTRLLHKSQLQPSR